MADTNTQPAKQSDRTDLIREQLCNTRINLAPLDEPVSLAHARRVPLGQIASLGAVFASIPKAFRTATQTIASPGDGMYMRALDAMGNPLSISQLQQFKGAGAGALGSMRVNGSFAQAHFYPAGPQTIKSSITMPVNPAMLAMGIALWQVNQKLDVIQKTVDEIFGYMRQHDRSEMRGNLQTLTDVLNGYSLNWDNQRYMDNAHMKVLDIKQDASQKMDLYHSQLEKKLADKAPIELHSKVRNRLDGVLDLLKDYQLATYIYVFASFLDPMIAENFRQDKLSDVQGRIESASVSYRKVYAQCYDAIKHSAKHAIDAVALGGLAAAGRFVGGAVAATPVGDATPIDEALKEGGDAVGKFNDSISSHLLQRLSETKPLDVLPFQENIELINTLYNEPSELLTDGENLYLLPTDTGA